MENTHIPMVYQVVLFFLIIVPSLKARERELKIG